MAGEPKYSEKTCPSAALCTTNPTCCPDANPGRRGGKPATNRFSYGTAREYYLRPLCLFFLVKETKQVRIYGKETLVETCHGLLRALL
jgi:hypothetical protein